MSIYNEDEMVTPSWITKNVFEKVIKLDENCEYVEIFNLEVSPATLKGDHFGSVMLRVGLKYATEHNKSLHRSFVIKTVPEAEGVKMNIIKNNSVFETEIDMYTKTLPMIEDILAKHGDNTKIGPRAIYAELTPVPFIIFEDLCSLGFEVIRGRTLTEQEIKGVLFKLSKLHAVSYMLAKSDDKKVTKYRNGIFCTDHFQEYELVTGGIHKFLKFLQSREEFLPYATKFELIKDDIFDDCKALYRSINQEDILVLNHGDFHMKNLMYKYNGGKFKDVMLLDFQLSCFGPSVIDLKYATNLIYDLDTRLKKQHEMVYYYFENFVDTLKKIDCNTDLPRYSQFKICDLKYRRFSIFLISSMLPVFKTIISANDDELKDMDTSKIMVDGNYLENCYYHPAFVQEIKQLLPKLLYEGYMD